MSDIVEIIDLTGSSPIPQPQELPDPDPTPTEQPEVESVQDQNAATQDGQARKKRKRRSKRSSLTANAEKDSEETPRESRTASEVEAEEQRTTEARPKRKRSDEEEPMEEDSERRQARRKERKDRRREERKNQNQDDEAETPDQDLFFVDFAPAPISSTVISAPTTSDLSTENAESAKLLVPAHVTVLGSTPVEIIQPLEEGEEDEDFINYLDYEDTRPMLRYYNEAPDENVVLNRTVCKNCGAEGDHKTSACTIMICLTCGVRNEHSTRSCPISKVCFTCGMKGHINANCPNRRTARALQSSREIECDRCSSSNHKTNECPTVWRQYEYFTSEEQTHIIAVRQSKKDLPVGQGGEGYVADDEWCYYCGQSGHWGDDCQDMDRPPSEHSAFSRYNVTSGPFYDPTAERKASTSRPRQRDWENGVGGADEIAGWGKGAPDHVGRQGRMKSRAALERQMQEAEDDVDDWFGGAARRGPGGANSNRNAPPPSSSSSGLPAKPTTKGFVFGKSMGSGRQYAPPPNNPPSLLARIAGEDRRDNHDSRSRSSYNDRSRKYRDRDRDRDGDRDDTSGNHNHYDSRRRRDDRSNSNSNHYSDRRRNDSGPRYRGGYVAR